MLNRPPDSQCHPGLLLDKWHDPWSGDKTFARDQLKRVTAAAPDQPLLGRVRSRFAELTPACVRWTSHTSGPLTLHLSRAGSFENAGICLHPVYGFAYLPGTGLKGMARAYARNVARAAPAEMEEVFGKDVSRADDGAAGAVVFYDALPIQWPKLIVDIVNNHNGEYYDGKGAPGDWEEPVPVNFLAISPGSEFEFCLGVRRGVVESSRGLALAKEWINGALLWLGAGAKTNAGYGRFSTGVALPSGANQRAFTCTLTLETPAFLAGALQESDDCTLRAATLRGMLRWWWRTMHAGHLPVRDLLSLGRTIWGGAAGSGEGEASALSISLEPVELVTCIRYRKQEVARAHGLKRPDRQKSTLGIAYISYGMEEKNRNYVPVGSRWKLTMVANSAGVLSSQQILDQAKSALWLLTNFGGVGSKGRKGFGSLETDVGVRSLEECRRHAADVRAAMRYPNRQSGFLRESPSLEQMLGPVLLTLPGDDVWWSLDQLGGAIQEFAQSYKHRIGKKALGLPRRMREPDNEFPSLSRHASPVHFHLGHSDAGFKATVVVFPSARLPNFDKNREFLQKLIEYLRQKAFGPPPSRVRLNALAVGPTPTPARRPIPAGVKVGALVEGTLLAEKTRKGGWKAQESISGLIGPIQNTQAVPITANPGDPVKLKVKVANPAPAFEYVSGT